MYHISGAIKIAFHHFPLSYDYYLFFFIPALNLYICARKFCSMRVVSTTSSNEKEVRRLFESGFKQYFKPLCFYAMSFVKDDEVARDIVHDVFLTVWNNRTSIDFGRPMYPYLLNLTRNSSLNYLAHLKVKSRHEENLILQGDLFSDSEDDGHEELIARIMNRIDTLPARCREVMYLYLVECKKYKEIATQLDISVNTIKTHITAGLKILREEFPSSLLILCFPQLKK